MGMGGSDACFCKYGAGCGKKKEFFLNITVAERVRFTPIILKKHKEVQLYSIEW